MAKKPEVNSSLAEKEIDRVEKQFEAFDKQVKDLTMDNMNQAPKLEQEPQTKLSQKDLEKSKDIYLKPKRTISSKEKFNETYREAYNFAKEYVQFIAEHKELIGEVIEMWTKPFAGMPAEEWVIPTNKPVWAPRYVAEQIRKAQYTRLVMKDNQITGSDSQGNTYYGQMVADSKIQRLDAYPANTKKSIFMNAANF